MSIPFLLSDPNSPGTGVFVGNSQHMSTKRDPSGKQRSPESSQRGGTWGATKITGELGLRVSMDLTLRSAVIDFEERTTGKITAHASDWPLGGTHMRQMNSPAKALKTDMILKPQPTESWSEFAP